MTTPITPPITPPISPLVTAIIQALTSRKVPITSVALIVAALAVINPATPDNTKNVAIGAGFGFSLFVAYMFLKFGLSKIPEYQRGSVLIGVLIILSLTFVSTVYAMGVAIHNQIQEKAKESAVTDDEIPETPSGNKVTKHEYAVRPVPVIEPPPPPKKAIRPSPVFPPKPPTEASPKKSDVVLAVAPPAPDSGPEEKPTPPVRPRKPPRITVAGCSLLETSFGGDVGKRCKAVCLSDKGRLCSPSELGSLIPNYVRGMPESTQDALFQIWHDSAEYNCGNWSHSSPEEYGTTSILRISATDPNNYPTWRLIPTAPVPCNSMMGAGCCVDIEHPDDEESE
ncbi:hypothetical protein LXT21_43880 [Myxococcus sp. K38C18041901]|uniref:hypothetical protein n=1 Tax=Myxococcus guangdongensis TaxID=2906760 RepID=UPI0020A710B7|nr:hypothetical protein [Myxococcus guangdongensis]MCP3065730.1 hypothetical protein [Myxococcus guangdongensis]